MLGPGCGNERQTSLGGERRPQSRCSRIRRMTSASSISASFSRLSLHDSDLAAAGKHNQQQLRRQYFGRVFVSGDSANGRLRRTPCKGGDVHRAQASRDSSRTAASEERWREARLSTFGPYPAVPESDESRDLSGILFLQRSHFVATSSPKHAFPVLFGHDCAESACVSR